MIKKFAKLQVTDDGDILCSKCDKVLAQSTPDYFRKHQDASDVWILQLADDHFKRWTCPALMSAAQARLDMVQGHCPNTTLDDVYQCLI